jgi:hypothetical protein
MDDMSAHAKPRVPGLIAAWLCLVIAGAATVTFNVVHAWRSDMASVLGVVEGVVPVALAMIVSHLVATSSAGKFLRGVTFAVMIGALALSVRATGTVVAPAAGPLWWLYGAVIDTAALVSLQVLLALKAKAVREAQKRSEEEAAAADERTALRAELETARAALGPLQAALEIAQGDLAESLTRTESLTLKLDTLRAKKRPQKPPKSKRQTAHADDLTIEFRAFELLRDNPELRAPRKGAELGRRLEASAATGNRLHRRLIVDGQLVQPLTEPLADRSRDQS